MFKILLIKGENDEFYEESSISDDQFNEFVHRHEHLRDKGIEMAPENNDDMTESYLMVSPFGEFYQNLNNEYIYSDKIHEVGVKTALGQVSFDYTKFVKRGGKYDL